MTPPRSPIAAFLGRYERALVRTLPRGWPLEQTLTEACQHLETRARALHAAGRDRTAAEREAVARFGDAEELARDWANSLSHRDDLTATIRWAGASATGGLVGLALALGTPVAPTLLGMMLLLPAAGLAIGAGLGTGQWMLWGRPARICPIWWISATGLGVALGITAATVLVELAPLTKGVPGHDLLALLIIGGGTGAALGAALAWQLRRLAEPGTVLRATLAGAAGLTLGGMLAKLLVGSFRTDAALGLALVCATGLVGLATRPRLALDLEQAGRPAD